MKGPLSSARCVASTHAATFSDDLVGVGLSGLADCCCSRWLLMPTRSQSQVGIKRFATARRSSSMARICTVAYTAGGRSVRLEIALELRRQA